MEYGIIGEVLKHSFSKSIHETLGGYSYEIKELTKNELASFMNAKDFKGINVTIPYKKDVIPFLDFIDDSVKAIGSCNVVVNRNNKLYGYNTDYVGFIEMLDYFSIDIKDKSVAILGNGGASLTVQYAAKNLGAKDIYIISTSGKNGTYSYEHLNSNLNDVQVIINTTPVGMYPNNHNIIVDINNFASLEAFVDVVYNPLKTLTVVEAEERGIKVATGLYMLVAQAVYGIEHFLNKKMDKSIIAKYYEKLLKEKENIVLVGMPTSGKTTIGKLLADKLNRKFIDTDEEITKVINMPISDYFAKFGEEEFRKVESDVIKNISIVQNSVIATGGGSILKAKNIKALKQNGKIYFLDRSLENLITTSDRPLSSDRDALKKRYMERIDIYRNIADMILNGDRGINEIAEEIMMEVEK